jgi:CheY-like chemotaxis protein
MGVGLQAFIFSLLLNLALPADAAVRLLLLDDLSDQSAHAEALKQHVLKQDPATQVTLADSGSSLKSLLEALVKLDPPQWDLLLFDIAHPGFNQGGLFKVF